MSAPLPPAVTFKAVDPRKYYDPKGSSLDHIRRNQRLPLIWTHLTQGDVAEIRSAIRFAIEDGLPADLEACLAIECILTTGRTLRAVSRLHYFDSVGEFDAAQHPNQTFGIINHEEKPYWILPQGDARRARTSEDKRNEPAAKGKRLPAVRLPASELTVRLLALATATRGANNRRILVSPLPHLKQGVEAILKNRCIDRSGGEPAVDLHSFADP